MACGSDMRLHYFLTGKAAMQESRWQDALDNFILAGQHVPRDFIEECRNNLLREAKERHEMASQNPCQRQDF